MMPLPNLLIVDDTKDNLLFLSSLTRRLKINLIQALSGHEALEKTKDLEIALAILDVRMPGMNGYELAKKLNEERSVDKVPVIFITANQVTDLEVFQGYGSGAVDYIFKPIDNQILLSKINVFLDLHKQKHIILNSTVLLEKKSEELIKTISSLRMSEEKYRSYIDHAPDGVFIVDDQGRYLEVNESACKITGYSKSELLNMTVEDLLPEDFVTDGLSHFRKVIKTGSAKDELFFKHKDGTKRWWSIEAVKLSQNRILGFAKDITQRKIMEESIRIHQIELEMQNDELNQAIIKAENASQKYEELYDFAPSGYYTITSKSLILALNHSGARIFEMTRADLKGSHFSSYVSDESLPVFHAIVQNVFKNLGKESCELILQTGTRKLKHAYVEGRVAADNQECLLNVIDITGRIQIEKALQEAYARLQGIIEGSHVGTWEWNITTGELVFSELWVQSIGYTLDELAPITIETWESLIHPADLELFRDNIRRHIAGELNCFDFEYRLKHKEGQWVWVQDRGRVVNYTNAGKPLMMFGTHSDISERIHTHDLIRESESSLNKAQRIAHMGSWECDLISKKVNLSTEMFRVLDIDPEAYDGNPESLIKIIHPDDVASFTDSMNRNLSRGDSACFEFRVIHKDGSVHIISTEGQLECNETGKPVKALGTVQDITERKLAEQALKESQEKYKTMLNASPDGILIINLQGIITDVSDIGIELFGEDNRDDVIGEHFIGFVPSEEKRTVRKVIEKTMNEGIAQSIEMKVKKKNQAILLCEISSTLIQEQDGTPLSFMVILRDISQRKELETKQIHADRMASLGEMASGIAHEINQPLNTMSLVMDNILCEVGQNECIDKTYLKRKSEKIFENITRIRNIIDHVRAFSRSYDDYILTEFDINTSITQAVSMISEQYKHLAISINLHLADNLPVIIGNTFRFEQVILNFLSNAKDALIEKKDKNAEPYDMILDIKSFQENQRLIVSITDNGVGISEEDIKHIILPFYTTKDVGKGTGLGLSISYQIIKEMNGTIEIVSNILKGTTFTIIIMIPNN